MVAYCINMIFPVGNYPVVDSAVLSREPGFIRPLTFARDCDIAGEHRTKMGNVRHRTFRSMAKRAWILCS